MSDHRSQIVALLSDWILLSKSTQRREEVAPSPDADQSDDTIKDCEERVMKLRIIRTQIEEL